MRHTTKTTGVVARVEPMPSTDVLEIAPDEVHEALTALSEANEAALQASRDEAAIRKRRRLAGIPSEIRDLEDDVHSASKETSARALDARRAAGRLGSLLDRHANELVREAARLRVERHVQSCDAYAAFFATSGGRAGRGGIARQPHELMPWVDPGGQARPNLGDLGRYLDETNVPAMLEAAGTTPEEAGLVEVEREVVGGVLRFLTTPARAALDSRLQVLGQVSA